MEQALALEATHRKLGAVLTSWHGFHFPLHYGDPGREYEHILQRVGIADRSYRGLLSGSGKGVCESLNGVIASEVAKLGVGEGQLSAFLTPKGKLLGSFRVYRSGEEECLLLFSEPLREDFQKSLSKYTFLNEVELNDECQSEALISVEGPCFPEVIMDVFGVRRNAWPTNRSVTVDWEQTRVLLYPSDETRGAGIDVQVSRDVLDQAWEGLHASVLSRGGGPVGKSALEVRRVEAGKAHFGVDYDATNFPNEARLEGALSYSKCYVGQEVVARMRTYGHANRRLVGLRFTGEEHPSSGDELFGSEGSAGNVTSAVSSPRYGNIGLGMVGRRYWEPGTQLQLHSLSGATVQVADLPFDKE